MGTFILIILAVLVIMVFINFQKQKQFSRELRARMWLLESAGIGIGYAEQRKFHNRISYGAEYKTKDKLRLYYFPTISGTHWCRIPRVS